MASKSLGTLTLDLVAKIGGFEAGMDKAARASKKRTDQMKKDFSSLGKAFGVALAAFAGGVAFQKIAQATIRQEAAMRQLEQRIKSTGAAAGLTAPQLSKFASSLQSVTTYGDEAIIEMESLLLTFTNIKGPIFKDATRAILDMSTAMGTDLKSSAIQLGKALNDPVKGISALSRVGVSFTESQKETIKQLVEMGRTADAQRLILKELQTEFGGAAEAAADTFGGALKQVQNAFGDLLEANGGLNEGKESLKELAALLSDPQTVEAANSLTSALIKGFSAATSAMVTTVNVAKFLADSLAASFNGPALDDIVRIEQRIDELSKARDNVRNSPRGRAQIPRIDAEIAKLEQMRDLYYSLNKPGTAELPELKTGSANGASLTPGFSFDKKTTDAMQKALVDLDNEVSNSREAFDLAQASNDAYFDNLRSGIESTRQQFADLNDYLKTDAERTRDAYERRQSILDDAHAKGMVSEEQYQASRAKLIEKYNEEALKNSDNYWERYLASAKDSLTSFDELAASTLETFSRGFGSAFEKMIFDSESLGDAFRNLAEGMARSVINALGQMIGQWVAYQAVQLLVGKSAQSAAATTLIANAQATSLQAQLAAFASTAAIPIVGPALAPGALAAAAAITEPLAAAAGAAALAGVAHDGYSSIPREGTWLLNGGERIVAPEQNRDLTNFLADGSAGKPIVNLYQDAGKAGTVNSRKDNGRDVIDIFVADLMGDGRVKQAMSRKFGLNGVGS